MSDEGFYTNGFFRKLERERKKQEEAEKKAQEKAQEKTAREIAKAEKAQGKTAQQVWDELPSPSPVTPSNWGAPTHGNTILDELAGAVEGYAASGGELPAFICLDENGRFWLTKGVTGEDYGFRVWVDADGNVQVSTGTAQFWGGTVKVYAAADLGEAEDGSFVYAILHLDGEGWEDDLAYGDMTGQDADTEIWVPIAQTNALDGGGWKVTQLHWGNIAIPAVANAVDVQAQQTQQAQGQGA